MRGPGPPGSSTALRPISPTNRIAPTVMKYLARLGIKVPMELPTISLQTLMSARCSHGARQSITVISRAIDRSGSLHGDGWVGSKLTFLRRALRRQVRTPLNLTELGQ